MSEQKITIEKIIETMDEMRKIINNVASNIDLFSKAELSKKALDLSMMKSSLGGFESELEYSLKLTEMNRRTLKGDAYIRLKESKEYTYDICKIMANKEVKHLEEKEIKLKSLLRNIKILKQDTISIITVINERSTKLNQSSNQNSLFFN